MKNGLIALILMAAFSSAALAQPPAAESRWAEKMFKDGILVHDFGTVPHGASLYHRFTITNIYAVQMEITGCVPSCGCVTATPTKRVLLPREVSYVDVQMDGRKFTGPKTVTIKVTVGPDFISTAELRVTATSRPDIVFNPGQVKFDTVARGQTPTANVDVEYAGTLEWKVNETTTSKEAPFEASVKEIYRKPGQVGYKVKVTLKPDAAPGPFKEFVYLKTNDPNAAMVPMLVEGNVQSPLTVSPASLALGTVKTGEALTRRVVVRGNKPFRVTSIEGAAEVTLGTEPNTTPNLVQTVTFQVLPTKSGPFKHEIKVKTDLEDTPVVVVIEGVAGS
jgi:hypothetical protein